MTPGQPQGSPQAVLGHNFAGFGRAFSIHHMTKYLKWRGSTTNLHLIKKKMDHSNKLVTKTRELDYISWRHITTLRTPADIRNRGF